MFLRRRNVRGVICNMENKTEGGYTLIELVVVLALLVGLTTTIILNGSDSRRLTHLNNATLQLESMLTQAQAYGHSGQAFPVGDDSPEAFDRGYGIYAERNSGTILMYGGEGDTNGDGVITHAEEKYTDAGQIFESVTLEGGVVVSRIDFAPSPANQNRLYVLFRRGETGAHIHGLANAAQYNNRDAVTITLSLGSLQQRVVVNKTGLIYITN